WEGWGGCAVWDTRAGKSGFGGAGVCAAATPASKSHARGITVSRRSTRWSLLLLRSALLCPPMPWLVVAAVCVYFIAYGFYGLFVPNRPPGVDAARLTPADRHND